jgi:hypothetical protein
MNVHFYISVQGSVFALEFLEPYLGYSSSTCDGALKGEQYNLRDCGAKKRVKFLRLCRLRGIQDSNCCRSCDISKIPCIMM